MKNVNNTIFYSKFVKQVKNGEFDEHLTLPFMSKDLFLSAIKDKLQKRISSGGTPILSDTEITECIETTKETALYIIAIYIKLGFIEKTDDGYVFTKKGNLAIKAAYSL